MTYISLWDLRNILYNFYLIYCLLPTRITLI